MFFYDLSGGVEMRFFGWAHSMYGVLVLSLCLLFLGLTTAAVAQPIVINDSTATAYAAAEKPPEIEVWKADPVMLDTAASFAVYTFKVKGATDVEINEAGVNINSMINPTGATLEGTANGNPASSISTDENGQFICTIVASNPGGSVQEEVQLSLAKELLPESPPTGTAGNQAQNKSHWLEQTGMQAGIPPVSSTTNPAEPDFFKCPESCKYCLEPGDAASHGFTQRCSDQRCFYNPDNTRSWYCYSEPEGWCCANEQVSRATRSQCARMDGYWSINQYEAQEACQPEGYCCYNNEVYYPITQVQCLNKGGSYWSRNRAEVMAHCQQRCWCCAKLQVFESTQTQCLQSGGTCYSTQSQAAAACRVTYPRYDLK
jgi:hypothetical protein